MRMPFSSAGPRSLGSDGSALGFVRRAAGNWSEWDRFLTLDGKPAYHLGNICNTCAFLFERLDGANRSLTAEELGARLESGASMLDRETINRVGALFPVDVYLPFYSLLSPRLVVPGGPADYFSEEQVATWGLDGFWGLPHHPKTEYYRTRSLPLSPKGSASRALYEFIAPMFPHGWLEEKTLASYRARTGVAAPTALAISVLDVEGPATWNERPAVTEHWCLTHYLLDGHHKAYVAAETRPVGVLSFLAVQQGTASVEQAIEAASLLAAERAL
jgi:hypothetical protein